ncbi:hypothetical protein [Saccharococcus caldoxylosilyticus]|jgi:hypothetical protein|uniref:Uncharacterized protein n=2 Tax=Saccharococcus caldoxylosilyticus TaxID=81408 RepID=A0A023DHG6_9BACL|nr:hypothetical protein [Parageobacillus caldoxylosilyticus]QNU39048.1 hypothetical protein IC801_07605 [Geobacillus sp. 44B]KYD07808.1 hypothetical protein B4119_3560 [Parageobacillus caldoxylosilyticus]MBB3852389.1 hypothetical protein [Parageobacillus caldoxylosilyticus]QXJ38868.1 hypothetical protein BV455_02212 [Parageobacillus caldoxylosilyticus]BDG37442.1 hypothetical protein PcaKH15_33480 [Parageobacillus caldoxylosilyticus]
MPMQKDNTVLRLSPSLKELRRGIVPVIAEMLRKMNGDGDHLAWFSVVLVRENA